MKWLVPLLFLVFAPQIALAACINPAGVEGEITNNADYRVLQYCDNTNWIAMVGAEPYYANAVTFDGAADSLARAGDLTGISDTKMWSGSGWFRRQGTGTGVIYTATSSSARVRFTSLDIFEVSATNVALTEILRCRSGTAFTDNNWHSFVFSVDLSDSNKKHLYIDDVDELGGTCDVFTDDTIGASTSNHQVGSNSGGSAAWFNGDMADLWLDFGTYIDLSIEANRRKFMDANGNPVFLGATGARPTGSVPDIFLSGDTATWHTNDGTGGGFTENGALTDAATYPGGGTQIVPSGLVGHWRLDETSGSTVADSSGNGHDGTIIGSLTLGDPGVIGTSITMPDSADDYIRLANDAQIKPSEPLSISVWYKGDGGPNANQKLFQTENYADGGNRGGAVLEIDTSSISIGYGDTLGSGGSNRRVKYLSYTLPNDRWVHIVGVIRGQTDMDIYIDGVDVGGSYAGSATATGPAYTGAAGGKIGGQLAGGAIGGSIDDVRLYERDLSPSEVTEIYNARDGIRYNETNRVPEFFDGNRFVAMPPPFPDVTDGLAGHWKLDETSGTTAADSSGNGNDGTMQGGQDAANDSDLGAVGRALASSSSTSHYVDLGTAANLKSSPVGTWSLWAYRNTDNSSQGIFHVGNLGYNSKISIIARDTGRVEGRGRSGSEADPFSWKLTSDVGAFPLNEWVHVALVQDGVDPKLYVDGILQTDNAGGNLSWWTNQGEYSGDSFYIGGDAGGGEFDGSIDDVRVYDRALSATEIQKLYNMGTPAGSSTALPQGCPNIGDVCDDGTVYAGLSPDGNVAMFTTQADGPSGLGWNDGNTSGYADAVSTNCGDGPPGTDPSCSTGAENTNSIVITDADTATGGFQEHQAAQYCYDLSFGGNDDWYLPAMDELVEVYDNHLAIGNFSTTGPFPTTWYWTSSENTEPSHDKVRAIDFSDGSVGAGLGKNLSAGLNVSTRCVRKGSAPRCANPYGLEGAMLYNDDYDVIQYCDGARWIGIGKTAP